MNQSDRYIRLKRKSKKSASQSFENERHACFIQDQFNTQDAFASTPVTQGEMSVHHYFQFFWARTIDPDRPSSSPTPHTSAAMTDPGALELISTENGLVFAHVFTTTAAAAPGLIAVIPRELVALPLPVGAGTSPNFRLDSHHVVLVLENGRDACGALDSHRRRCWSWIRARARL